MDNDLPLQQPNWIPLTKILPPQVGEDILARTHLLNRLYREVMQKRLTLISAPAGSGKTITAASLVRAYPKLPLAWLALDEDDNDPVTFMWALVSALKKSFPECGSNAMALLLNLPNPATETQRIMGVLINDVLTIDPPTFALVLDDYHLINEPDIHDVVAYLLERLPPPLHLVIATRQDPQLPLARLRARGQLAAFHLEDLRFQENEVQVLFHEHLSLHLPLDMIQELQIRTEGWIAGLRLLASTLQSIGDAEVRHNFINQLADSDRHVFDLLADEVLSRQPPELQTFLLETSILGELTPRLCSAVTTRKDAHNLLAEAYQRNLFLLAVGEYETAIEPVYRYHDLFAGFLRHQLEKEWPDQVKELHRRAAAAETISARTIYHYLAAEAWEEAGLTIEKYGLRVLQEGRINRLEGWITTLPDDIRQGHPWLNYLLGMCYGESGHFIKAEPHLQAALQQFKDEGSQNGTSAALVALAYTAVARHDFEQAAFLLGQVLERSLSPYERVRAHINRAYLRLYQNDWSQVDTDITTAMQVALSSRDQGAYNVLAQQLTTPFILGDAGIAPIEHYCQTILASTREEVSVVHAGATSLLGHIQFLQGDLEKALITSRRARELSRKLGGFVWMDMAWDFVFLAEALIQADYITFERRWGARLAVYEETVVRQWLIIYLYFQARALWMQNRWDELRQLARRADSTEIDFEPPESYVARLMIAALVSLHDEKMEQAETLLGEAENRQLYARHIRIFFDSRFVLAHLYLEWNRTKDAVAVLRPVLAIMVQQNTPGFILQEGHYVTPLLQLAIEANVQPAFVQKVLEILEDKQRRRSISIPNSTETLTPREVEVLQLLLTGATNKKIAEQLVITPRTAKAHVSNILHKLGVTSRTEAVVRARELSILID